MDDCWYTVVDPTHRTVVQEDVSLSENFSEPINVTLAATEYVL